MGGIGLASVMTAHVLYPAYDEVPATFSKRILKGLLRDTLHFPGFVFSDDLSMRLEPALDHTYIAGTGTRPVYGFNFTFNF